MDSMWARTMRDKYIKRHNFFRITKKKKMTPLFGEIINHTTYLGAGLKWYMGDGRKV